MADTLMKVFGLQSKIMRALDRGGYSAFCGVCKAEVK